MLFNSFSYMIFLPLVLLIFYIIPKKIRYIWILVASYYFYMSWNAQYALLIGFSTIITWGCALIVSKISSNKEKRFILFSCLIINLSILVIFKYSNFLIDNLNYLLPQGAQIDNPASKLILPVGISFYTFQAIGYLIDVFRGDILPEKNILKYALFVSFFPQLVAGPIERSGNLLSQINALDQVKFDQERIRRGLVTMLWGFFLKIVVADNICIIVDSVYDDWRMYGSIELMIATVAFAIQIYCDFASYSTIAIGTAEMMGVKLMENFNAPYFATSIKDFWRRWHISLSSWLRDYVYIPLGGNRKGKLRKQINVIITFLISGIWHGANWTYIIWGGLHGLYQVIEDIFAPINEYICVKFKVKRDTFSMKFMKVLSTFILSDFAWLFFRATSVNDAMGIIYRILTKWNPWTLFNGTLYTLGLDAFKCHVLIVAIVIVFLVDLIKVIKNQSLFDFLQEQNIWFEWCICAMLLIFIVVYGAYGPSYDAQQFIYFQF